MVMRIFTLLGCSLLSATAWTQQPEDPSFPGRGRAAQQSQRPRLTRPQRAVSPSRSERAAQTNRPRADSRRDAFDDNDPTQSAPDMRRILEGEQQQQQQLRRDPPPPVVIIGKVIRPGGIGFALLRVGERVFLVEKGMRFSLPTNLEPIGYTVTAIDVKGVTIESDDEEQTQRLP